MSDDLLAEDDLQFDIDTGQDPLRILVTGDREWNCWTCVSVILHRVEDARQATNGKVVLMHGDCRGLDRQAGEAAERIGWEVLKRPAQWSTYGRAAGVIRNQTMLDEHKPHLVIGFHDNLAKSRGTVDCLTRALRLKVPVILHVTSKCKVRRIR